MVGAGGRIETQVQCTCAVGRRCQQRGCHVLQGPPRLGYVRWVRGHTVCVDCDAVTEGEKPPGGLQHGHG
jgi:hypothetical protein